MEIRSTIRHQKVTEGVKAAIKERSLKLEKFHDKITSVHVIIDSEAIDCKVEIVCNVQNHTVTSVSRDPIVGKALDAAFDKMERQLKKLNQKLKSHKARRPVSGPEE